MGMQQNNHSDKEVSKTINQTPKLHNKKNTKHKTQHNLIDQNPETENE